LKLQADYPIKLLCEVLALPRSSWYFKAIRRDEASLQRAVAQVIEQFPTYGSRRLVPQLWRDRAEFKTIGRKRVRRVLGERGLQVRRKALKQQTTDSRHAFPRYPNLVKELEIVWH
jgi:putative transposase